MAFELTPGDSLRKAIRRIVRKQLDRVMDMPTGARPVSRDDAVHETRISVKRIRAVLRLVRPEIGKKIYDKQSARFRQAARPLTEVRDAKILIDVLDDLIQRFPKQLSGSAFDHIRKVLQVNFRDVQKRVFDKHNPFAGAARSMRKARQTIKTWTDVRDKWSAIGPGLRHTYRQARDAHQEAIADSSVEKLHQWRKQVKYLRYQLNILRPVWPERMQELTSEADRMGQLLGDDHDLAVLTQTLTDGPEKFGSSGDVEALLALIDRRRSELQQEATMLAEKFFLDKPREFERRLESYWKSWRDPAKQDPSQPALASA